MHGLITKLKKLIHTHLLKRLYYREGQCNMCGSCCQKIYVRHSKGVVKDENEFGRLKTLHPFYTYLEVIDKDDLGLVFKCNNFQPDTKTCSIHNKRPGICRRYPSEEIFKMGAELGIDCGYRFVPIEPFSEVLSKSQKNFK